MKAEEIEQIKDSIRGVLIDDVVDCINYLQSQLKEERAKTYEAYQHATDKAVNDPKFLENMKYNYAEFSNLKP